ncbi:MAG: hypothetical protein M0C28_25885 [Candidatus Moduliflexus flocculans]|nr:hypothetical protein [Candidatus Moduliflexus flocculans]
MSEEQLHSMQKFIDHKWNVYLKKAEGWKLLLKIAVGDLQPSVYYIYVNIYQLRISSGGAHVGGHNCLSTGRPFVAALRDCPARQQFPATTPRHF